MHYYIHWYIIYIKLIITYFYLEDAMNNFNYKQIQTIQDNTTKKLIKYINDFIEEDKNLDPIEFYYPNFDEQKTRIAFNIWISTDYKTHYNKTFIEHMLEEKSNQLSSLEKEILIERNKSYVSLFEISNIEEEYIELMDLLTRKCHTIWEPNIAKILKPSDLIFGRIGKIINHKSFIGNISFLPPSIKDIFIEEVFIDYNYIRLKHSELTIDKYLKQYSVNLYRIYTECVYDALEMDEDTTSIFYDEIEEFESYLQLQTSRRMIKKHVTNLINLYEFYFLDSDMTLYDLDQVDLERLFKDAIEDGFISAQWELSSYISTLKKYLKYLKSKNPEYRKTYDNILEVSQNRFLYTDYLKQMDPPFNINRHLSSRIVNVLNEKAFKFIMDYERFILYIMNSPLEVTATRKYLKRKDLFKINEIMENQEDFTKKAPNQEDFTMLHLFYKFSIDNNLINLDNNLLHITKKGPQFLRLSDEEKFSLLVEYLWSNKFLSSIGDNLDIDNIEVFRESILKLLGNLEVNTFYRINTLLSACIDFPKFLPSHNKHLELMGLIKQTNSPLLSISTTSFGKVVFRLLAEDDSIDEDNFKIIDFNTYRKNR